MRAPEPSALGPTVISTILPAVFSNTLKRFVVALRSRPLTAIRYSPACTFTPGSVSGAAELWRPVETAEDLLEPIPAVLNGVVRAEQTTGHRVLG